MNDPDGVTYDSEMHSAIVVELARWICKQCLGVNAKGTDRAGILAKARKAVARPHVAPYGLDARAIATEAEALADRHMETDVNWDQWAFGH
jgi:hypothetical protein